VLTNEWFFKSINKNQNLKLINKTINDNKTIFFWLLLNFDETNFGSFGVFGEIHLNIAQEKGKSGKKSFWTLKFD
jgi:hypothetical protein